MENQNNLNSQFVPYDLAIKLGDLGFTGDCLGHYFIWSSGDTDILLSGEEPPRQLGTPRYLCSAPLWSQAFDWLLENHQLYGLIIPTVTMYWTFKTTTINEGMVEVPPYDHVDGTDYSSIQEARQACLEKLIELVTMKNK